MGAAEDKDFNTETLNLYRISGVAGLLLQKGQNVLANHLPFSDQRSEQLGELIRKMTEGYSSVQRNVRQVLVNYDSGTLLVLHHTDTLLALLLTSRADLDVVSNAASVFMSEHADHLRLVSISKGKAEDTPRNPEAPREMVVTGSKAASNGARLMVEKATPEISRWPEIRRVLESLLCKVMGRAQTGNMIKRVCTDNNITDPFQLPTKKCMELAMLVLEQIPNRSKRAALEAELTQTIKDLNL